MTETVNALDIPVTPSTPVADPLAAFAASPKEREGVTAIVEEPNTGAPLMKFRLARFGGSNNAKIIRVERELKGKLTQGQRRAIDAGGGDPDVVMRLNRQVFVRTSILGYEPIHPALKDRFPAADGAAAHEGADKLFEQYPGLYDAVSELASDEEKFAADKTDDTVKN